MSLLAKQRNLNEQTQLTLILLVLKDLFLQKLKFELNSAAFILYPVN